ncbi:unnamed protein product [Hapterophycus canaliculatus]
MDIRFRRMMTSEEGRKMLAMEVEALKLRQVARHARPQFSSSGTHGTRRNARRLRAQPYSPRKGHPGEEDDVEMALLKPTGEGSATVAFVRVLVFSYDRSDSLSHRSSSSSSESSGSSSDSGDTGSTGSSFSLHLSSDSDGGSDLSLLTSDVVLERLEKVERVLLVARGAVLSVFRASCDFGRYASVFLWTVALRGTMRVCHLVIPGRSSSLASTSSSSFASAAI